MPIVIIDDCALTMAILKGLAGARGERHVIPFTDACAALGYLREEPAEAICVDYQMPDIDGIEFTRAVRATSLHFSTPIIMLTGSEDAAVRMRALEAGVTEFLRKPVKLAVFKALLEKLLPTVGAQPQLRRDDETTSETAASAAG